MNRDGQMGIREKDEEEDRYEDWKAGREDEENMEKKKGVKQTKRECKRSEEEEEKLKNVGNKRRRNLGGGY